MKPITSPEDRIKKEKRNKMLIGVLLIAVMIISTAGFAFFSSPAGNNEDSDSEKEYNGVKFFASNGLWVFNSNGGQFAVQYTPDETEDIKLPLLSIASYISRPLYLTSEESEASTEVARNMQAFVERMQYACLQNYTCADENLPEKSCDDNVIIINEGNITEIRKEENCVFINSNASDGVRLVDAFLFGVLGVR